MTRTFTTAVPQPGVCVVQAVDAAGHRHELALGAVTGSVACRTARRAATLLAVVGDPQRWRGARVDVIDAVGLRLVAAVRVPDGKAVTRG